MNQLTKPKIRFSNAAQAIGVTPKALRNWLARNEINLMSDHSNSGWTDFTLGDIAILAIMRELIRWGTSVNYANEIAYLEIMQKSGALFSYRNTPKEALIGQFSAWKLVLYFPDQEGSEPNAAMVPAREFTEIPSDIPSLLILNPGQIIKSAYENLPV